MALARVVTFDGVDQDRVDEMSSRRTRDVRTTFRQRRS